MIIFSVIFVSLFCGCQKSDPVTPVVVPPVVKTPTISVSADTTLNYGENYNLTVSATDFSSITLNGNNITGNFAITINTLLRDTIMTIIATNAVGAETKSVSKIVTIKVRDYSSSTFGILSHYKWTSIRSEELDANKNYLYDIVLSGYSLIVICSTDWHISFYEANGTPYGDPQKFSLANGDIIVNSFHRHIESISLTRLVYSYVSGQFNDGSNSIIRETFAASAK